MKNQNSNDLNPAERQLQGELRRLGISNAPIPEACPGCGGELLTTGGMVGESILYCPADGCASSIVWEDQEDAIRRVL